MTTPQKSYDIQPGQDLNDNAGFVPLSVLVDNYSPYWLLLPDAGRWVPPYTSGIVLPLIHATTNRAQWINPPLSGLSTPSYVATAGYAHLTYVALELAYSAGAPVPLTALSQQQSFSVAEGGTISKTLPFLAQGVRIDNPGGTCYTIVGTSLIIPPWTTAWIANFTTPFNTITVQPITNPNGTPNTTLGGPIVATFYAQPVTSSGGTPYTQPTTVISLNQFKSASQGTGNLTIAVTISPSAGDLLVAAIQCASNGVPSAPSGWNLIFGPSLGAATNYYLSVFTKVSDGTEGPTVTFTNTGTSYIRQAVISEYSNVPKSGIKQSISSASISASATLPTLTVGSAYVPWLFVYIWDGDTGSVTLTTPPAGFTGDGVVNAVGSMGIIHNIIGPAGNIASGTGTLSGAESGIAVAISFA